jgi:ABC-type polysaccharide/polyol phosphate transport system ATPase subunit
VEHGKTVVLVSHDPTAIRTICRRVCVLEHGELVFDGNVARGLAFYDQLVAGRAQTPSAMTPL